MAITISIGGNAVDVYDGIEKKLCVSRGIQQEGEINSRPPARVIPFTIPATPNNNAIYDYLYDSAGIEKIEECIPISIKAGSFEILGGLAFLKSVCTKDGCVVEYKVSAFGGIAGWVLPLEGIPLCDCLPDANHTFDQTTVEASWSGFGSLDYVYYPVIYDYVDTYTGIKPVDLRPAIYVQSVIREIFNKLGHRIKSEFLDSEFFRRLTIPYTFGRFGNPANILEAEYSMGAVLEHNNIPLGNQEPVLLTIPITKTGRYCLYLKGLGEKFIGDIVILHILANGIQQSNVTLSDSSNVADEYNFDLETFESFNAGDNLTFAIEVIPFNPLGNISIDLAIRILQSLEVRILNSGYGFGEGTETGDMVNFKDFFDPEKTALAFVKDLFDYFGLVQETDNIKKIVCIEPRDQWECGSSSGNGFVDTARTIIDLTNKLDLSKKTRITKYTKGQRTIINGFKNDDNDINIKEQNETYPDTLYSSIWKFSKRFKVGEKKEKLNCFAGTIHRKYGSTNYGGPINQQLEGILPVIESQNELIDICDYDEKFCMRILYYKGFTNEGSVNYDGAELDIWPQAFVFNYGGNGTDPNIGFGDDVDLDGNVVPGVFQKFHFKNFTRLQNGRYIDTTSIRMGLLDICGFSFRDRIKLNFPTDTTAQIYHGLDFSGYKPEIQCPTKFRLLQSKLPTREDLERLCSWACTGFLGKLPALINNCPKFPITFTGSFVDGEYCMEVTMDGNFEGVICGGVSGEELVESVTVVCGSYPDCSHQIDTSSNQNLWASLNTWNGFSIENETFIQRCENSPQPAATTVTASSSGGVLTLNYAYPSDAYTQIEVNELIAFVENCEGLLYFKYASLAANLHFIPFETLLSVTGDLNNFTLQFQTGQTFQNDCQVITDLYNYNDFESEIINGLPVNIGCLNIYCVPYPEPPKSTFKIQCPNGTTQQQFEVVHEIDSTGQNFTVTNTTTGETFEYIGNELQGVTGPVLECC